MWRTKDGRDLEISEIDISHLQNIMAFLERRIHSIARVYDLYPPFSWIQLDNHPIRAKQLKWLHQTPLFKALLEAYNEKVVTLTKEVVAFTKGQLYA